MWCGGFAQDVACALGCGLLGQVVPLRVVLLAQLTCSVQAIVAPGVVWVGCATATTRCLLLGLSAALLDATLLSVWSVGQYAGCPN